MEKYKPQDISEQFGCAEFVLADEAQAEIDSLKHDIERALAANTEAQAAIDELVDALEWAVPHMPNIDDYSTGASKPSIKSEAIMLIRKYRKEK